LSINKNADGSTDAEYDLGIGVASANKDASGNTSGNLKLR
jgi:hypothetical protein